MPARAPLRTAILLMAALHGTGQAFAKGRDVCAPGLEPWTEIVLFLGRAMSDGTEVGEADFQRFLGEVVTPLFPDGLTVLDAAGQFRSGDQVMQERAKVLLILVPDAAAVRAPIASVVQSYKQLFRQDSVLRTEREVCLAFD
jgi:hypothetical protein